jgi:protein-L-isoaspartate(D-aspartate) O-methyltransferase
MNGWLSVSSGLGICRGHQSHSKNPVAAGRRPCKSKVGASASWRSGYAEDCKSFYPGSIPGEASIFQTFGVGARLAFRANLPHMRLQRFEQGPLSQKATSALDRTVLAMTIDFAAARRTMVENQLRTYDVLDPAVTAAMLAVPRENYVPEARRMVAYLDQPVPLSSGRTLLTPMVLGRILQAVQVKPGEKALDVAGGTGYSAHVLHMLGAAVTFLDHAHPISSLPGNIRVLTGNIAQGVADHAPFNVILINGAIANEPEALFSQLAEGGRLAVILGSGRSGRAMVYRKAHGVVSGQAVFDAAAVDLPEFAPKPVFSF